MKSTFSAFVLALALIFAMQPALGQEKKDNNTKSNTKTTTIKKNTSEKNISKGRAVDIKKNTDPKMNQVTKKGETAKKNPSSSEVHKYKKMTLKSGSKGISTSGKDKSETIGQNKTETTGAAKGLGTTDQGLGQGAEAGTKKGVKSFQKKKKLGTDGIVGPKTISAAQKKKQVDAKSVKKNKKKLKKDQ